MVNKISVIGLPNSGKTTFLAALWHLVNSSGPQNKLILDSYSGDFTYLEEISSDWLKYQKVKRTLLGEDYLVTLPLKSSKSDFKCEIYFPDLAGEYFNQQIINRTCKSELVKDINESSGILLFINPDIVDDSLSQSEVDNMIKELDPKTVNRDLEKQKELIYQIQNDWTPEKISDQAKIVQLLQDLSLPEISNNKFRLIVMVSAWDLISVTRATPQKWLSNEMPLLSQFLSTNQDKFNSLIYGISAQGGKNDTENDRTKLAKINSDERAFIVNASGSRSKDLTEPLFRIFLEN